MVAIKVLAVTLVVGTVEFIAVINFSNTITVGSMIAMVVVVIVAGLFTIRANTAKIWRENYEGEHTARLQSEAETQAVKAELLKEREEQQVIRHDLKDKVAGLKMKTDLSIHEVAANERHAELAGVLVEIRNSLQEMTKVLVTQANGQEAT